MSDRLGWKDLQGVPSASGLRAWVLRKTPGMQVLSWLHRNPLPNTYSRQSHHHFRRKFLMCLFSAICAKTCHRERGYCRKPGECRCKVGWWGKNCEKCYAYPGCVNGNCTRPWECNCKVGWGGMLCDEGRGHCEKKLIINGISRLT